MKKQLLLSASAWLLLHYAEAQITLSNSCYPSNGTTWIFYHDNRTGVHTITPASGSAQTWNYANAFVVDDTSFISWKNPSATPYASNFPQATHAEHDPANNFAVYYKGISSGFYLDGLYDGQQTPPLNLIDYNPDFLILPVPFTYNNTRNQNARLEVIQTGSPSIKVTVTVIQQLLCDAFGTLTTPAFSNQQVLRIRSLQCSTDSTFIDVTGMGNWMLVNSNPPQDSQLVYLFVRNQSSPSVLMEISADPFSPQSSIEADYSTSILTGITENQPESQLKVYPNPISHGTLKFEIADPSASVLQLFDLSGKMIYSTNVKDLNAISIFIDNLASGSYIYHLKDHEGKLLNAGKVMVARE